VHLPRAAVELSIRGVDTEGFSNARLDIDRVTVTIDGVVASVQMRQTALELALPTPAIAASFSMPKSASTIHVEIALTPAGVWEGVARSGSIDARGLPISFDTTANMLRNGVDIRLSVGNSLQTVGLREFALLPDITIYF
jgi:hypothetical protein